MSTIDYYNENAEEFCSSTLKTDLSDIRNRFLQNVVPNGIILDAGCGSGRDTIAFMQAGFRVESFDASEEICRIAEKNTGIHVRCLRFEDLDYHDRFDAVWACASILHVERNALPSVFLSLAQALKMGGVLYASFKRGNPERVVDGRYFYDPSDTELELLLEKSGLFLLSSFVTDDARPGRDDEKWTNIICRKMS